jgi:hypothetical protein
MGEAHEHWRERPYKIEMIAGMDVCGLSVVVRRKIDGNQLASSQYSDSCSVLHCILQFSVKL